MVRKNKGNKKKKKGKHVWRSEAEKKALREREAPKKETIILILGELPVRKEGWWPDLGKFVVDRVTSRSSQVLHLFPCRVIRMNEDDDGVELVFTLGVGGPPKIHIGRLHTKQSLQDLEELVEKQGDAPFFIECCVMRAKAFQARNGERVIPFFGELQLPRDISDEAG